MIGLSLSDCAAALDATHIGDDVRFATVGIDTRRLPADALYVAIVGERFDGHDFASGAAAAGAVALLVARRLAVDVPQLVVSDTRAALGRLARLWAEHHRTPTLALTGSNGKTTVKEMLARILATVGSTCVTQGNLNNEIGVPLTLLSLRHTHRYAVIEMGANHAGEIARLAAMTPMDVALVNNVGDAHLEGFGSRAGVAAAKSEIYAGLDAAGIAIVNVDDAFADTLRRAVGERRCIGFGRSARADVRLIDAGGPEGERSLQVFGESHVLSLSLPGAHNRLNAAAAVAGACALGISPAAAVAALDGFGGVAGRLMARAGRAGIDLIDDSYNANPASTHAAIDVLSERSGQRTLVLGAMAELGPDAPRLHAEVGRHGAVRGIERLFSFGDLARFASEAHPAGRHFDELDALGDAVMAIAERPHTVLVKGSRSARMERLVARLAEKSTAAADESVPSPVATSGPEIAA